MTSATKLEALDRIVLDVIRNKPNSVGPAGNSVGLDLELNNPEVMEDILTGNVQDNCSVYGDSEYANFQVRTSVESGVAERPVELVTACFKSWATLSEGLGLVEGGYSVAPRCVRLGRREKSVYSSK